MQHHVSWPDGVDNAPVYIKIGKSASEILEPGYLTAEIKALHAKQVGVMIDADVHTEGRYQSIRNLCRKLFPLMPASLPIEGLVVANQEGKRFGVWIMPDNDATGCLETFLQFFIPNDAEPIWQHATDSVSAARRMGAPCKETHVIKANLYTWLAWQDEPGQSPGLALTRKILDPLCPYSEQFVNWFKALYQV